MLGNSKDKKSHTNLANAITSIITLHELYKIRCFYPDAIKVEEARELQDKLVAYFELSLSDPELKYIRDIYRRPDFDDLEDIADVAALQVALLLANIDAEEADLENENARKSTEKLIQECLCSASDSIQDISDQVMDTMVFNCQIPMPDHDKSYQEPKRFLQMVELYWDLAKKIILPTMDTLVDLFPNPLIKIVVNINSRLDIYLEKLSDEVDTSEVKAIIGNLLDTVIGGELDTLSAEQERTYNQLKEVELFLARAQLSLGSKSYPLTYEEDIFIERADNEISGYFEAVKNIGDTMIRRSERIASSTYDEKEQHPEQPIKERNNVPRKGYGGDIILDLVERENGWHWFVNDDDKGVWCKRVNSKKYKISHILFNQIGCGWIPHETFYQAVGWDKDVYFDRTGDKGKMQRELNKLRKRLGVKIDFRKAKGVKFADNIVKAPK